MLSEMAEDHVYEVEKILSKTDVNGTPLYRIRWKGFSSKFDTWEPKSNLGSCKELLKVFEENNQITESQKKVKEKARKIAQGLVKKSKQLKTKSEKIANGKKIKLESVSKAGKKSVSQHVKKTVSDSSKNKVNKSTATTKVKSKSDKVKSDKVKSDKVKSEKVKSEKVKSDKVKSDSSKKVKGVQQNKIVPKDKTDKKIVPKDKTEKKSIPKEKSVGKEKTDQKPVHKDKPKSKKLKVEGKGGNKKTISVLLTTLGNAKHLNVGKAKDSANKKNKSASGNDVKTENVKKGVKRKLQEVDSDDEDILYSLNDVIDMPVDSDQPQAKPVEKGKDKAKNGERKFVVAKSKSSGDHDQEVTKAKKRLSLIDSMKKKKGLVNASVSQSLPPLPFFTTVKPLPSPNRAAIPGSSLLMDKFYADIPTFSIAPSIMPVSPSSISYKTLLDNLPMQMHPRKASKKAADTESESEEKVERRISVRTTEYAFRYKQIVVKKCSGYTQIWLNTSTAMKNAINPQVVHEIVSALNSAKYDDSNLVMLSSIGNVFCSGIDLNFLLNGERRVAARQMVDAVRDLIKTFITFPKPIVAAVPGPAIGLGMAILPLCDVIYASDKALFYLPYSQLSQTPEGCISFTLPLAVGLAVSNELLFVGRKITAMEAYQLGLVSQVFWPTSVMQEVIPRVQHMALYSAKAMEATKLLIRSHHRTKLELTNETECNLLLERWSTMECQRAIETYLSDEKNFLL